MKLEAHLEITYSAANNKRSIKPQYSVLSCIRDNSNKNVLLINSSNKSLTSKFNIVNNIEKVFCKFIEEGKATIQLKEPSLTLFIQKANPNQLKVFLKSLHLACKNEEIKEEAAATVEGGKKQVLQQATNSALNKLQQAQAVIKKPKTTMTIKGPADYIEFLRGYKNRQYNFSEVLSKLEINESNMYANQLNKHLYQHFKQLAYLNLDSNNLRNEIGHLNLPSLKELSLSRNQIESFDNNTCDLPNLVYLNVSHNRITRITNKFCQLFRNVKELHLNNNQISCLNNSFGFFFNQVKVLSLHSNLLNNLPYSLINLRLDMVQLDDNRFQLQEHLYTEHNENLKVNLFPKLMELSARCIVNTRIYYPQSYIPATLDFYVSNSLKCVCGRACFNYAFKLIGLLSLSRIAQSFSHIAFGDRNNLVPTLVYFCSVKCFSSAHNRNPFIIW